MASPSWTLTFITIITGLNNNLPQNFQIYYIFIIIALNMFTSNFKWSYPPLKEIQERFLGVFILYLLE